MRWGVYLTTAHPPGQTQREVFENSIAYVDAAEDLGYDAVWLLEHHFTHYGLCPSPLTMAAFVLGRTRRLKVGTAITVVPLEHPVRLAEQVALLDQLGDGRLYFGIGRGGFVKDFHVFDVDMSKSHEILAEWTEVMIKTWTEGRISWNSERLNFNEVEVFPEPRTRPHPPIYTVASSPSTVEWAARNGFPMLMSYMLEDEVKMSQLELYAELAADAGHDPAGIDHALSCIAFIDDSSDEANARIRRHVDWWLRESVRAAELYAPENRNLTANYQFHHRKYEEAAIKGQLDFDTLVDRTLRLNPVGTAEECVERLSRTLAVTGIRHVICGFEGASEQELALQSMKRFQADVIPFVEVPSSTAMAGSQS